MSPELRFETITEASHAIVGPAGALFNKVFSPPPDIFLGDDYKLYVATHGLQLVGAANVCDGLFDDLAYIHKIAVDPAYRNQGVGSALLRYTLDDLCIAGKPKAAICPSNDDNKRLYERLGFVQDPSLANVSEWLFKDLSQHDKA